MAKTALISTIEDVRAVTDLEGLAALEADWTSLHRADPEATVFTSFPWLRGRLSALTEPWRVLAARSGPAGGVVGLLPLRAEPAGGDEGTLAMAGSPLADYTGFLCLPDYEEAVVAAFASHVRERLAWRRLAIRDARDSRLAAFLGHFPEPEFRIVRRPPTPCAEVELDDSWEGYLSGRVGPGTRQTIRRKLRAVHRLPDLRRTSVADGGERQISTLVSLWQMRWGELPEPKLAQYLAVFRSCLESGLLWLDVLWDGSLPIAGLLAFLDRGRGAFRFYVSGFDPRYAALSPGMVIVAHSVREAIRGGFRSYDFLRGDEPYKLAFGARARANDNVDVLRGS